jgi:GAF domain-containing protein
MRFLQNSNNNEDKATSSTLLNLLVISIVADVAALVAAAYAGFGLQYIIPLGALLAVTVVCLILLLRGNLLPAQILLPTSLFIVLTIIIAFPPGYGLHDINLLAYAVVLSLAGLTLGQRGTYIFAFLVILAVSAIGIAEMRGILVSPTSSLTLPISPIAISIVVLAITFIQRAFINLLNESAKRALNSEAELTKRNKELQNLTLGLEKLVQDRTAKLETANQSNARRAKQFEAISQVSRAINQTQNLQDLLPQIAQVITQQFDFYHVGIFFIDTNREYAVLVASNSEGGQRMLARNHKLKIGQVGIVGNVAGTGIPRIALDTGADAVYFNNPDMPATRSEMALPLFRGSELTGIIDIQSVNQNAFGQEDIQILTTLADQVSIAIANARLYEETQKALLEAEMLYRRDIQTGWAHFSRSQNLTGIRKSGVKTDLLRESVELPIAESTRSDGMDQKKSDAGEQFTFLTVPMRLRGETVGLLNVKTAGERAWSDDEMDIITAIIERAALSIESARLLNESQKRAIREQTISQISARIGASTEIETILKTAVRELGSQISGAQVTIEIGNEDE